MINYLSIKQAADDIWRPVTKDEADVLQRIRRSNDALTKYINSHKEDELDNANLPSYLEPGSENSYNPSLEVSYKDGDIYLGGNKLNVDTNPKDFWKGLTYENGKPVYRRNIENDKGELVEDYKTPSKKVKVDTLDPNGNVLHTENLLRTDNDRFKYVNKVTNKAFNILQKKYRKGVTPEEIRNKIDPNGLLTYNGVPFGGIKSTLDGIDELPLIKLRANKQYADKLKNKQAADQLWDNGEIYTRPFHFGASHWDIRPSERDAIQLAAISDPTERRAAIEQLVHNSIDRLQRERAKNMKNKMGFTVAGAYLGGPVGAIVGHSIDKNRVPSKRVLDKREKKYNDLMRDRYPEDRVKYQAAVEAAVARLRADK